MLESCTGRRHITVENGQSHKSVPKVTVTLYTVTCLAIIILGALALAGVFHPSSSLGILGHTFGKLGAGLLIGTGGLLLFGNVCYCPIKKVPRLQWQQHQWDFVSDEEGGSSFTGAPPSGYGHSNLHFNENYLND